MNTESTATGSPTAEITTKSGKLKPLLNQLSSITVTELITTNEPGVTSGEWDKGEYCFLFEVFLNYSIVLSSTDEVSKSKEHS
jgi:hypothetical protein